MRGNLLSFLVCPACQGELSLVNGAGRPDEEGRLVCDRCTSAFPIRRGIPRFAIPGSPRQSSVTERTRRTYTFTWRRVGQREIEEGWEKDSYRYEALLPDGLMSGKGKVGLDAGCGSGADLLRMAASGAQLIGVDLSEGVDIAARVTRHLSNVHVVQADIHRLPFRPGAFDFIYSFGVLHHLPDPSEGFRQLARLLKPGAPLVTYLYEDLSDRSRIERGALRMIRAIRGISSRLPAPALHVLCWLGVPVVWLCCSMPAHLLRDRFPRVAGHLPFRHTLRWPVLASDLFDRFAPPVEWRFSRDGVTNLYRHAGLDRVEIRRYRGWVSWGFKPAAGGMAEGARAEHPRYAGASSTEQK